MRRIKVFLDSSVIIAGLASRRGGSYEVLALAELGVIAPHISEEVVHEVLRNVQKKLPRCYGLFYKLLENLPFIISDPSKVNLDFAKSVINEKDALILAAAMAGQVDWLLSLDKHFLEIDWKGKIDFSVGTPGKFLQELTDFYFS